MLVGAEIAGRTRGFRRERREGRRKREYHFHYHSSFIHTPHYINDIINFLNFYEIGIWLICFDCFYVKN